MKLLTLNETFLCTAVAIHILPFFLNSPISILHDQLTHHLLALQRTPYSNGKKPLSIFHYKKL